MIAFAAAVAAAAFSVSPPELLPCSIKAVLFGTSGPAVAVVWLLEALSGTEGITGCTGLYFMGLW